MILGTPVSGMKIGIYVGVADYAADAAHADKVTALEALSASMQRPQSCIIEKMPSYGEGWETAKDDPTTCENPDEILQPYQTNRMVEDSDFVAKYDKGDPFIALLYSIPRTRNNVVTLETVGSNGTDKVWSRILINKIMEDNSATTGKVKLTTNISFLELPIRN